MDVQYLGHFMSENVKPVHMTFKTAVQSTKKKKRKEKADGPFREKN